MLTLEWFQQQLKDIRTMDGLSDPFRFIHVTFQFQIDDEVFTFHGYDHSIQSVTNEPFHHDYAFRMGGSREAWNELIAGTLSISQGINALYGHFTITGSRVAFTQNMYYLDHFIKALRGRVWK